MGSPEENEQAQAPAPDVAVTPDAVSAPDAAPVTAETASAATEPAPSVESQDPGAVVAAISDDIGARAWKLVAQTSELQGRDPKELGESYIKAGDKQGITRAAYKMLDGGDIDGAKALMAASEQTIPPSKFKEVADAFLAKSDTPGRGGFKITIQAYKEASLPALDLRHALARVLTVLERSISQALYWGAVATYTDLYREVNGVPPPMSVLTDAGMAAASFEGHDGIAKNFFDAAKAMAKPQPGDEAEADRIFDQTKLESFRRCLDAALRAGVNPPGYPHIKMCKELNDPDSMKRLIVYFEEDGRWDVSMQLREWDGFGQGDANTMKPDPAWFDSAIADPRCASHYREFCLKAGFKDKLDALGDRALGVAEERGLDAREGRDDVGFPGMKHDGTTFLGLAVLCFRDAGNNDGLGRAAKFVWERGQRAMEAFAYWTEAKMEPPADPAFFEKLAAERIGAKDIDGAHAAFMRYLELGERTPPPSSSQGGAAEEVGQGSEVAAA